MEETGEEGLFPTVFEAEWPDEDDPKYMDCNSFIFTSNSFITTSGSAIVEDKVGVFGDVLLEGIFTIQRQMLKCELGGGNASNVPRMPQTGLNPKPANASQKLIAKLKNQPDAENCCRQTAAIAHKLLFLC